MNNMMVTDIVSLDNKKGKVYINGEYAFPLYLKEIRRFNIIEGHSISGALMDEINEVLYKRIRERALYLLERMPRTEHNLRKKLLDNHYTEEYITPIIIQLKEYGFINDFQYALDYADSMRNNRGMSKRMVISKLYEKGVSKDIINEVEMTMSEDESDLIEKALKKKGLTLQSVKELEPKDKQKIYRYLINKGFPGSCINMY